VDELPPHARRLLDAARLADEPTAAQRARADSAARAALGDHGIHDLPELAPQTQLHPMAAPLARVVRVSLAAKWGLSAAALVTMALIVHTWGTRGESDTPAQRGPELPARTTEEPAAARLTVPMTPLAPPTPRAPAPQPDPTWDVPKAARPRLPQARGRTRVEPASSAVDADDSALQHELRLLAAVDALIRRARFDEALQLLGQGERAPATTRLLEERSALRVLALCGKAPTEAARQQRERFLRLTPHSVLAARVREACAPTVGESP